VTCRAVAVKQSTSAAAARHSSATPPGPGISAVTFSTAALFDDATTISSPASSGRSLEMRCVQAGVA